MSFDDCHSFSPADLSLTPFRKYNLDKKVCQERRTEPRIEDQGAKKKGAGCKVQGPRFEE
jgi:hypothetical protein